MTINRNNPERARASLRAKLSFHQVDCGTQCECSGGPRMQSMSGSVNLGVAFVLDERPWTEIRQIFVPIVDDYVA